MGMSDATVGREGAAPRIGGCLFLIELPTNMKVGVSNCKSSTKNDMGSYLVKAVLLDAYSLPLPPSARNSSLTAEVYGMSTLIDRYACYIQDMYHQKVLPLEKALLLNDHLSVHETLVFRKPPSNRRCFAEWVNISSCTSFLPQWCPSAMLLADELTRIVKTPDSLIKKYYETGMIHVPIHKSSITTQSQ